MLFKKKKKSWRKNKTFSKTRSSFLPKKRNSVKIFKKIIVIIFISLIIYFFFFSQFFLIKKFEIEGNKNISSAKIEEIINNNISQNNFFLHQSEEIEEILRNELSEIELVEVNKKFPNLLEIKISEKHPLVIWCRLDNCYYIDDNGLAFLSTEKKALAEENEKIIKIIEQLKIEEEAEDNFETNKEENITENKNNLTYQLNSEQFEKIRLFFVGEDQNDWIMTYPVLFAITGEDLGLPVLSEISGRFVSYTLDFSKIKVDDLKRIEVSNDEKIFQIRINFNYENKSIFINVIEEEIEIEEEEIIFEPIKINDQVSDSEFINFAIKIDREIKNKTALNINYYKTKETKSRELIAYTDKNTRIYFNTTADANLQINYLKDFLAKGIDRKKIDSLKYIYLKSGNKIFYK